ncbi:MAG: putative ABC transporter ATP-binding protein [Candidatus Heimdallarchaeota archaeon LC_3]|nr:MAG: putative ABC transporter ATP-binding protein [Candidatus Heimdallarchaeota archaeon LC_3]
MSESKNNNNSIAISIVETSKRFHSGDEIIHAIDNCSLEIYAGQFVCIMGPSGSGKSTLLNLIGGLSNVTEGKISVFSQTLHNLSESDRALLRRKIIGIIFQFYNLHEGLTAVENIELPMLIAGISQKIRRKKAQELLELVELVPRANNLPYELSGGEKQRVGIARSLSNDPKIILADEPTGDLDHEIGESIMDLLVDLNSEQGKTIVMVTHDLSLIRKGFRLIKLEDGKIISDEIVESLDNFAQDVSIIAKKQIST